ncbi:hypothetical protein L249_7732, partial [Ophiocordyceps polyrhachis-furcata BCC 54312]
YPARNFKNAPIALKEYYNYYLAAAAADKLYNDDDDDNRTRPEGLGGSRDAGSAAAGPRPPYVTAAERHNNVGGGYGYGYAVQRLRPYGPYGPYKGRNSSDLLGTITQSLYLPTPLQPPPKPPPEPPPANQPNWQRLLRPQGSMQLHLGSYSPSGSRLHTFSSRLIFIGLDREETRLTSPSLPHPQIALPRRPGLVP